MKTVHEAILPTAMKSNRKHCAYCISANISFVMLHQYGFSLTFQCQYLSNFQSFRVAGTQVTTVLPQAASHSFHTLISQTVN